MFKQQRFILRVLLCAVGLTSIFGLDKAWAMSWLGGEKIDAPLVKVSFCSGGDMLGSSHGLFVTAVDKEYALITLMIVSAKERGIYIPSIVKNFTLS